jgi:hypothetical protein
MVTGTDLYQSRGSNGLTMRQNSFAPPDIPSGSAAAHPHVAVWTAGVPPQLSTVGCGRDALPSIVAGNRSERRGGMALNDVKHVQQNDDRDRNTQQPQ